MRFLRAVRRSSLVVLGVLTLSTVEPTSTLATQVRQVAQLPLPAHAAVVEQASNDGRWLLVETADADDMDDASLWSVDTVRHAATLLTKRPGLVSQAPDGAFAGWVDQPCSRPARIHLVAAGQPIERTSVGLPSGYARSSVQAMTVSSSGRVTVLVSDGAKCYERGASAVLSAAPGAARLTEIVRARRNGTGSSVSPDGRVFALCFGVGGTRGPNPKLGKVVVVDTRSQFVVHAATDSYYKDPGIECAASDRGTATMIAVQRVPTASGLGPGDFRNAGVTVGNGRLSRFALRGGTGGGGIMGISPTGRQMVVDFNGGRAPIAVRVRDGAVHRLPPRLAALTVQIGPKSPSVSSPGRPLVDWSPFGDVIVMNELAARDNKLQTLTIASGRWGTPLRLPRQGNARICFLPSGRVLVAAGTFASEARTSRVYVSDVTGARFAPLSTASLGTVFSISCESATHRVYVTTTDSGRVFEADADAIDNSAFAVVGPPMLPAAPHQDTTITRRPR